MKKIFFIVALLFMYFANINAQIITTICGDGVQGFTGDDSLATMAEIDHTGTCSFDSAGNFYFNQSYLNCRIRMINTAGIITTVAGNGTTGYTGDSGLATNAEIYNCYTFTDKKGNIYITDWYTNRIRMVDAVTHTINTIAGTGVASSTGDNGPAILATLVPTSLCFDAIGNKYVADGGRIRKIDTFGIITTIAGTGVLGYSGDGGLATLAQVSPGAFCIDQDGNLLFANGLKIRKLNLTTNIITFFAGTGAAIYNGDGINADSANFRVYGNLVCDANGNIYFGDFSNERVRWIDAAHIIHTIAGTGTGGYTCDSCISTGSEIFDVEGVALDKCNNLYLADGQNFRIRKITFPITIPTLTLTPTPNDTVCSGTLVTYHTTITGGGAGTATYQ